MLACVCSLHFFMVPFLSLWLFYCLILCLLTELFSFQRRNVNFFLVGLFQRTSVPDKTNLVILFSRKGTCEGLSAFSECETVLSR